MIAAGCALAAASAPLAAQEGARVEVMHFGKRLGATVSLKPFYDPENTRLRA